MIKRKTEFYLFLILVCLLIVSACGRGKHQNSSSGLNFKIDSTSLKLKYVESVFTIPSPGQTLFLLKSCNLEFKQTIISTPVKSEKYTTTFRRSLIFGIWGADISYLNLYSQKEIALHYLDNLKPLMEELELSKPFDPSFYTRIEENFGNNDSAVIYLSELFRRCDEYLKYNDRTEIGSLILTGGWIESFYFLTKLYSDTNDKRIFALILYQKEVVNNLIKILSPLYKKTSEYTELITDLTEIAYEFDVVDTEENITKIISDSTNNFSYVKNNTEYKMSGSQLIHLGALADQLRTKHIN